MLSADEITLVGVLSVQRGEALVQEKTVSPETNIVLVQPDVGYDGLSQVTVNAVTSDIDTNITPRNIKNGVQVLGVEGTLKQGYMSQITGNTLVLTNQDGSDYDATVSGSELRI